MTKIHIIALISLIGGAVLIFSALLIARFDFSVFSTSGKSITKTYSKAGDGIGPSIEIDDSNTQIILKKSADRDIHITYMEDKNSHYVITDDNGICFKKKRERFWMFNFWNFNFQKLVIEIPEKHSASLTIKTSNAAIEVSNINADYSTFNTSNSRIDIGYFNCSNGFIADTSNGSINISNSVAKGNVSLKTSNSSVDTNNLKADNLTVDSSNGRLTLISNVIAKGIEAETSNSQINIRDNQFGDFFNCKTSNGGISGTLLGSIKDYSIISRTSNGRNSLPENLELGSKRINFKTSNSNIDVDFIDK